MHARLKSARGVDSSAIAATKGLCDVRAVRPKLEHCDRAIATSTARHVVDGVAERREGQHAHATCLRRVACCVQAPVHKITVQYARATPDPMCGAPGTRCSCKRFPAFGVASFKMQATASHQAGSGAASASNCAWLRRRVGCRCERDGSSDYQQSRI